MDSAQALEIDMIRPAASMSYSEIVKSIKKEVIIRDAREDASDMTNTNKVLNTQSNTNYSEDIVNGLNINELEDNAGSGGELGHYRVEDFTKSATTISYSQVLKRANKAVIGNDSQYISNDKKTKLTDAKKKQIDMKETDVKLHHKDIIRTLEDTGQRMSDIINPNQMTKKKHIEINSTDLIPSQNIMNGSNAHTLEDNNGNDKEFHHEEKETNGEFEITLDIDLPKSVVERLFGDKLCNVPSIMLSLEQQCPGVSDLKIHVRNDLKMLTMRCQKNQGSLEEIKSAMLNILQNARNIPEQVRKVSYISQESGVYIAMGRGALIKDIECMNDGRTLLVYLTKANKDEPSHNDLDSNSLLTILRDRYDLIDVHQFEDVKESDSFYSTLWGRIRCRDTSTATHLIEYTRSTNVGWIVKMPKQDNKGVDGATVTLSYPVGLCSSVIVTFESLKESNVGLTHHESIVYPKRLRLGKWWCKCWKKDNESIQIDLTKIPAEERETNKIGMIKAAVHEVLHRYPNLNSFKMNVQTTEVSLQVDHFLPFYRFIYQILNKAELNRRDCALCPTQRIGEKAQCVTAKLTFYDLDLVNTFLSNLKEGGHNETFKDCPMSATTHFHSKRNVSRLVYEATKTGIEVMKKSVYDNKRGKYMSVDIDEKCNGSASVTISGSNIRDICSVKPVLTRIISPLQMICLSNHSLQLMKGIYGQKYVRQLECQLNVKISCNHMRRMVNIYGPPNMKAIASDKLRIFFKTCGSETFVISLLNFKVNTSRLMSSLMKQFGCYLEGIKYTSGAKDIFLDMRNYEIIVCGKRETVDIINTILVDESGKVKDLGECMAICNELEECVACLSPLQTAAYTLEYCGHVYCQSCLEMQLSVATETKEFPLRCAQAGCNEAITWNDITKMLRHSPQQLQNLIQASVFLFVAQNKERYRLCLTAECPMIYSVSAWSESHPYQCPLCQAAMCRTCHVFSHEGLSCGQYKAQVCMDLQLQAWIDEDLENRGVCPRCAEGVEKKAGCYNVHCYTCKACVCWKCKQYFSFSSDCYEHLRKIHGSLY